MGLPTPPQPTDDPSDWQTIDNPTKDPSSELSHPSTTLSEQDMTFLHWLRTNLNAPSTHPKQDLHCCKCQYTPPPHPLTSPVATLTHKQAYHEWEWAQKIPVDHDPRDTARKKEIDKRVLPIIGSIILGVVVLFFGTVALIHLLFPDGEATGWKWAPPLCQTTIATQYAATETITLECRRYDTATETVTAISWGTVTVNKWVAAKATGVSTEPHPGLRE